MNTNDKKETPNPSTVWDQIDADRKSGIHRLYTLQSMCVVLALALDSKSKFSGTTLCYLQQFSEHIAAESVAIAGDLEDALSKITIQPAAASHE